MLFYGKETFDKQNKYKEYLQQNLKALMFDPNKDLGKWLLRDVFKLKEGILVSNELLSTCGIDSVRIDKISEYEFDINFLKTGSFEKFINSFN